MKKEEKDKILDMLTEVSHAHEEGEGMLWETWSSMHKHVSEMPVDDPPGTIVTGIEWDTDGEEVDLPSKVIVPEDVDLDGIADYLSDKYGFCVYSFHVDETVSGSRGFRVKTPAGAIEARELPDNEYPGIALLFAEKGSGEPGAVMEYTPSGKNAGHVQLRIYSKENPDDEPWDVLRMND